MKNLTNRIRTVPSLSGTIDNRTFRLASKIGKIGKIGSITKQAIRLDIQVPGRRKISTGFVKTTPFSAMGSSASKFSVNFVIYLPLIH
jgi:hypothetical protein